MSNTTVQPIIGSILLSTIIGSILGHCLGLSTGYWVQWVWVNYQLGQWAWSVWASIAFTTVNWLSIGSLAGWAGCQLGRPAFTLGPSGLGHCPAVNFAFRLGHWSLVRLRLGSSSGSVSSGSGFQCPSLGCLWAWAGSLGPGSHNTTGSVNWVQ